MATVSTAPRARGRLAAAWTLAGCLGSLAPTMALSANEAPASVTATSAADVSRARDLFGQLVAREAAFDPTTKTDLYADSAVFDFSLQYTDGTVSPIAMTIDDVRKAAPESMALARQQGIVETYADPVFTPLGAGRVRVDCRITFSDGGPESTMSQVIGPDPASGRLKVLEEKVRMVEMPDAEAQNGSGPAGGNAPTGPGSAV